MAQILKIKLDWQKRSLILFAVLILILSVILTVLAIREAEREKLVRQSEIDEEQQRVASLINDQVKENISKAEERILKLINHSQVHLNEDRLTEVAGRIKESEFLVSEIFSVKSDGKIIFPLFKPLYILGKGTENKRAFSVAIERRQDFKLAETAEFKAKNYSLAIRHYRQLLSSTSDQASRALLLNRIARCAMISGNPERAVDIYKSIVGEYEDEYGPDGIPYAVIALYQIGTICASADEQLESMEALLELYDGLLESRWSLSRAQFQFYLKKVNDELARVRSEMDEEGIGKPLVEKWTEHQQLEEIKLERMSTLEDIAYKILPPPGILHILGGRFHLRIYYRSGLPEERYSCAKFREDFFGGGLFYPG